MALEDPPPRGGLSGKVAVIVGGASGIGRTVAKAVARQGANVVIATPYDAVAMEPRWPRRDQVSPGPPLASASQLVLDCLTGIGRMPQEAEGLLAWMAEDEGRWRLSGLAEVPAPEETS